MRRRGDVRERERKREGEKHRTHMRLPCDLLLIVAVSFSIASSFEPASRSEHKMQQRTHLIA
jgi:hypothetical protein